MRRGWIRPDHKRAVIAITLALTIFVASCGGGNFAGKLRAVLALSGPLVDSLVAQGLIKPELRDTYIKDFTDLANGAASLKESLDACASDKPCKLDAVNAFQQLFFTVQSRGHFGTIPKMQQIQALLTIIINTAKAYYSPPKSVNVPAATVDREALLKSQIEQLKAAMQP